MRRTQIQLDEATYQMLRQSEFNRGMSMAALLREILREQLGPGATYRRRVEEFRFIGSGHSDQGGLAPLSERHDEALARESSR